MVWSEIKDLQLRRKWWLEERATVFCIVAPDGLLVAFKKEEVEKKFDELFPHRGYGDTKVWYFNETRDRECAETAGDAIIANPSILTLHFYKH